MGWLRNAETTELTGTILLRTYRGKVAEISRTRHSLTITADGGLIVLAEGKRDF
jgi:hypothetical protein